MTDRESRVRDSEDLRSEEAASFEAVGPLLERETSALLETGERGALLAEWTEIDERQRNLDDRLIVALIGGTGVGKSTFINALARGVVSQSGDRRPTTDRVVAYRHQETELPEDLPRDDLCEPQVVHQNDALRKVILLDFPDFDSVEAAHRDILLRHLPSIDVLFVVVDDVKYGDRRLFDLLADAPHDPKNLFAILNKVDRFVDRYGSEWRRVGAEILEDFRAKLLEHAGIDLSLDQLRGVSALAELESNGGDAASAERRGDFDWVRELLESFRENKKRREAKRLNLGNRRQDLLAELRTLLLDGERPKLALRAREHLTTWRRELENVLATLGDDILTSGERRALCRRRLRRRASSFGLPFGLLFTLFAEIGDWRTRGRDKRLDAASLGGRIAGHYRAYLDAIGNLRSTFESEFHDTTLSGLASMAGKGAPSGGAVSEPLDVWAQRLAGELSRRLEADAEEAKRPRRFVWHLPALGVLLISLWKLAYPSFRATLSADKGWGDVLAEVGAAVLDALNPVYIIGTVVAVLLTYLVTAGYLWLRELSRLDAATDEVQRSLRDEVRQRGGAVLDQVEARVEAFETELAQYREAL